MNRGGSGGEAETLEPGDLIDAEGERDQWGRSGTALEPPAEVCLTTQGA